MPRFILNPFCKSLELLHVFNRLKVEAELVVADLGGKFISAA
jgi:hypothetical protein